MVDCTIELSINFSLSSNIFKHDFDFCGKIIVINFLAGDIIGKNTKENQKEYQIANEIAGTG